MSDDSFFVHDSQFFDIGRIIAVPFSNPAGQITGQNDNSIETDELLITHIRIFVVLKRRERFCFVCPIAFDDDVTELASSPKEYAAVYTRNRTPLSRSGEALRKSPIELVESEQDGALSAASKIHLGIHYPLQYNVKVKDLGRVHSRCIPNLLHLWNEVTGWLDNELYSGKADREFKTAKMINRRPIAAVEIPHTDDASSLQSMGERQQLATETQVVELTKIPGPLDSRYEFVSNPRKFFKKGRFFMTLWAEPKGFTEAERLESAVNEQAFVEIARFVVIRAKATHCLCLRVNTYSGQGTTKPGIIARDHAAVIPVNGNFVTHPAGEQLTKSPIQVKVEVDGVSIDPMARINFTKIYTVEYNIKIRNVGRVVGDSVGLLEEYFAASLNLAK